MHKLSSRSEGPFIITEVISPLAYRLQWAMGKEYPILGTWSIYDDSIRRIVLNIKLCISFSCTFFQIKYTNISSSHLL
jgi:hypothetical protein